MCRVRAEFQSYTITFGKVADASETSAPPGSGRAIRMLQDIAEQHPDVADAARYGRITRWHMNLDVSTLVVDIGAHYSSVQSSCSWASVTCLDIHRRLLLHFCVPHAM